MSIEMKSDVSVEEISDGGNPTEKGSSPVLVDDQNESLGDEPVGIDSKTQENYRIWKKNTPFFYDYVSTTSLLWPSLTVQFFPDVETSPGNDLTLQRLLLGTFTLGQAVDNISILQVPYYTNLTSKIDIYKLNYTAERREFELSTVPQRKPTILQKIHHSGDVNKARYMPQNPDIVASCNNTGDLVVYDRTKHPNFGIGLDDEVNKPDLRLVRKGPTDSISSDIFAIDWNKQNESVIVSGDMEGRISVHDIRSSFTSVAVTSLEATHSYTNESGINDIEWAPKHDSIFAVADETGSMRLYDVRTGAVVHTHKYSGQGGLNAVSINPGNPMYVALGASDGTISVCDIRSSTGDAMMTLPATSFDGSVTQAKWHHRHHNVLAASSTDKTVKIFDLAETNYESNDHVLFVHAGHMLGVNDLDWSLHDDWLMATVADDNSLHVWKPAASIVRPYQNK
ncbi:chromatin assembly factor 1 subunit p50 [[Candida] anglica]|uniref:Chromatin assembly factor 1 subunit p50 n=1 Tax=[Candida] anglica TaxID=148631 RepID=A0ABP0EGX6_9ASCO